MMRLPRAFLPFPALALAALMSVSLAQGDLRAQLLALLPDGSQAVELMAWVTDGDVAAIKERMRRATSQDPRWFREYVAEHRNDPFLPWHPKFGVSQSEYQKTLTDDWFHLERTGKTARLLLTRSGNKVIFGGGPGLEALRGLSLDVASGELSIPEGLTARPHAVSTSAKDDQLGLGPRSGWGWTIEGVNLKTHTAVVANLNLMQLLGGAVILAYNRESRTDQKRQPSVNLTVIYERKTDLSKR